MVHLPGLALTSLWIQLVVTSYELAGFPHSESSGSRVVCPSPELFPAYHVLRRLHAPRHPPCALSSLTIKFAHRKLGQHMLYLRLALPFFIIRESRTFRGPLLLGSIPGSNLWDLTYSIVKEHPLPIWQLEFQNL